MRPIHLARCVSSCLLSLFALHVSSACAQEVAKAPSKQATAQKQKQPHALREVFLSAGSLRFRWDQSFAAAWKAPERAPTHGQVLVDARGRVLANTDGASALTAFSRDGRVVASLLPDWKGGLHGMCLDGKGGEQRVWIAHARRGEVVCCTLDGEVLSTIGWPEASALYKKRGQYHPTSVARASDGRIFVANGYGLSWVHVYDAERRYLKSFGGRGQEPGKMRTPHGLLIDRVAGVESLIVCDRENHRLQISDLDGKLLRVVRGMLRRPCNIARWSGADGATREYAIADLTGRVTLLGPDFKLLAHFGEQPNPKFRATNRVGKEHWRDGVFLSPHGVCYDSDGNLYVSDWSLHGRVSRLVRVRP